ncbi:MAG: UPF0175 family protein [Pirellulales bacterium]|nr:UPF0175 family protein [Pirellulales bacterium]
MAVTIELPKELEDSLRAQFDNLDAAAKEAALVEFYRQEKLAHHELSHALGLSRYETDGILKRHGIAYDISLEELDEQLRVLRSGRTP